MSCVIQPLEDTRLGYQLLDSWEVVVHEEN